MSVRPAFALQLLEKIARGARNVDAAGDVALAVLDALHDAGGLGALGTIGALLGIHDLLAVAGLGNLRHCCKSPSCKCVAALSCARIFCGNLRCVVAIWRRRAGRRTAGQAQLLVYTNPPRRFARNLVKGLTTTPESIHPPANAAARSPAYCRPEPPLAPSR